MATSLTDQLPEGQGAALEHFEGRRLCPHRQPLVCERDGARCRDDQGAEIEIDDLGCCLATGDERFATTSVNAGGE